jgi:hypothetical protein
MAVVHRNGGGGDCFRRGLTRVVVGSDERGGCSGRYGSGRGARRRHAHACKAAAVAMDIGLGRKTTGRGPRVSERGWERGRQPKGSGGESGPGEGGGPEGAEGIVGRRLKAGTGPTQEEKNPFQISFKIWIWRNFGKLYMEILKKFGHGDGS